MSQESLEALNEVDAEIAERKNRLKMLREEHAKMHGSHPGKEGVPINTLDREIPLRGTLPKTREEAPRASPKEQKLLDGLVTAGFSPGDQVGTSDMVQATGFSVSAVRDLIKSLRAKKLWPYSPGKRGIGANQYDKPTPAEQKLLDAVQESGSKPGDKIDIGWFVNDLKRSRFQLSQARANLRKRGFWPYLDLEPETVKPGESSGPDEFPNLHAIVNGDVRATSFKPAREIKPEASPVLVSDKQARQDRIVQAIKTVPEITRDFDLKADSEILIIQTILDQFESLPSQASKIRVMQYLISRSEEFTKP